MPEPARGAGRTAALTRKVGPLPVYAWALLAIGGYLVLRKARGTGGGATTSASQPVQPTQNTDGGAGAAAGGTDQGLLAGLLGGLGSATEINSNLTNALLQDNAGILGFGETALGLNAQLEQSIIASYVPSGYPTGGYSGPGPGQSAPAPQAQAPVTPSYGFSKISAVTHTQPFISFTTQNAGAFQHLANIGSKSGIKLH